MKFALIEPDKTYEVTYTKNNGEVVTETLQFLHYLEEDLRFVNVAGAELFIHFKEVLDYKEV